MKQKWIFFGMIVVSNFLLSHVWADASPVVQAGNDPTPLVSPLKENESSLPYTLRSFEVSALGVYQTGTSAYSLMANWTPRLTLQGNINLGMNLGITMLSNVLGENFVALEYQITAGMLVYHSLGIEVGAGAQSWLSDGGTMAPLLTGTLYYKVQGFIDRIFGTYSALFINDFYTSELQLGVGLSF